MESLSDKLKRLGVHLGTEDLKDSKPRTTFPVEEVIPGRFIHTNSGSIYFVEKIYPTQHMHGDISLDYLGSLNTISEWAGHPEISDVSTEEIVFLDTETSGLAGGTGTFAFMVGMGRYVKEGFQVGQFFMGDPLDEPALLIAIEEFLAPYNVLVTFNGKAFDVPLLNTRYILQGWKSPLITLIQIDLLHLARKLWRYRLPSRTLGDLELQILKARRTEEEVPGWMIPQMYFDYLRSRDARPMQRIFYHNEIDVLSMAALLNHTSHLIEHVQLVDDLEQIDRFSVARLYEDLGHYYMAINLYKDCIQGDLPEEFHLEAVQRLSFLYKRLGNYPNALELWEKAASKSQIYAFVELAKYYEHTLHDFPLALQWTEAAIRTIELSEFSERQRRVMMFELNHRYNRLVTKID